MTLYIILIFSAICVGMAISVRAFGTGGKRKRIFQDIYFSIEEVDGIGVLYTKTGEYSAVLKMENPVQKYSANIEAYNEFTHLFAALAQTLGEGYALHKQDVFVRKAFREETGANHEYLSESYFRYFNGRPYTDSVCYLTVTQENKKSRLMSFDSKKWRDFLVKIRKVQDQLRDAGVKSRFLGKAEASEYVDRFFSMNFRDKVVSMTNFKVDDETVGMGDRRCKVYSALNVLKKAELGEKVEYATAQNKRETAQIQEQLPGHFFVSDEIRKHPDEAGRTVVIVRDGNAKTADVVLPQGASPEVNNEIKGMNKQRFASALQKEGFDTVRFYNPDGALGFRPDDSYFAGKKITVSRLRNWSIEDLSSLDVTEAVAHSKDVGFDSVQMVKDDKERWALYIKPEGKEVFAVYPDKSDQNQYFTTLKQSMDNIENIRAELAQKYYAMAEVKPNLKVDIFGTTDQEVDLNRIQRIAVFRAKSGACLCAATIDGRKMQPRSVSPSQWQRLWVAPDRESYKQNLAASLFADVLQKDNAVEQTRQEKQEEATENKQAETATVGKHEEQMQESQHEDNQAEEKEKRRKQAETDKEQKRQEEKKEEKAVKAAVSPIVKQYLDLKKKHPDAVLLFRCGDFYETYKDDAAKASKILGITLTKSTSRKDDEGKPLAMAGFPYHALDTYLPKLIRAGERVAICDQLEDPRQKTLAKRGVSETASPVNRAENAVSSENKTEEQHSGLRR